MKKLIFNKGLFKVVLMAAFLVGTLSACSDDDDDDDNNNELPVIDHNDFKGDLSEDVVLDPTKVYKLTGLVKVKEGASLTLPAGTRVEAVGGTSAAIIVERGAQIFVNGTASAPVVLTSGLSNPSRGDWGGVVIAGRATCNSGGGMTEVGDVAYGGEVDNDNSGSIRYLRIEWSGAAFNSEKEYNGLSLFGVGSGTTIEYVQVHENADDGIEFYGGTVSANYLVSSHIEDDMFDWTEGWTGSGSNWFGKNDQGYGNRGFEGDNWSSNHSAEPFANPQLSNITLIGSGVQGNEDQGMELRAGTKGQIDNVVLKNWNIGIRVTGDVSSGHFGNSLSVSNVRFIDIAGDKVYSRNDEGTAVDIPEGAYSENEAATGAGAGAEVPEWAKGWTIGL